MNCIKCGREVPEGQVFCTGCLEAMAAYPIAPDAHIQIPRRPAKPAEKKGRELPLQEQVSLMKKLIRWLLVTVAVLLVVIGILSLLLVHTAKAAAPQSPTGRNYTTSPRTFN